MPQRKALTLYEFVALGIQERASTITDEGVHLLTVEVPGGFAAFFGLSDYWVELVMKEEGGVVEVVGFRKGARLDRMVDALPELPTDL
jgi:hypothetical protein